MKGVTGINLLGGPGVDKKLWIQRSFAWVETSYHHPGDTVRPDWDWGGIQKLATIGLLTGLRVANADRMPEWLPSVPYKRE